MLNYNLNAVSSRDGTPVDVRRSNRNRIFRYICGQEKVSNPTISYDLKMSLPTVMQNTKELAGRGLISEVGELESTGGRRAKALAVVTDFRLAAGLEIEREHFTVVLTNLTGDILKSEDIALSFRNDPEYFRAVSDSVERFIDESGADRKRLLGIGIAVPGVLDPDRGLILSSHVLGVSDISFESVEHYFRYPCYFLNDANAGAYAEGLNSGPEENFCYLNLSESVGGGIYDRGELQYGDNFRCGDIGHMVLVPGGKDCYCGKHGCVDSYLSLRNLTDVSNGSVSVFFKMLESGSGEAVSAWDGYLSHLALLINNIHVLLDIDVVIGGTVGSHLGVRIADVRRKVLEMDPGLTDTMFVRSCSYHEDASALGAALYVVEDFVKAI